MNNSILNLKFSHNWNERSHRGDKSRRTGKLDCLCFSTIRLDTPQYEVGQVVRVLLENKTRVDEVMGYARIQVKNVFERDRLTDGVAYLDTGYNRSAVLSILGKMYPTAQPTTKMCFLILKYLTEEEIKEFSLQTQLSLVHN